ncbi:MAG: hypothetical protein QXK67_03740 [Pyrobaculum sp.]
MASYIGYAAWSAMRRSTATTAMSAWLSFLPSHILGDVAVVVWSVLYRWVFGGGVELVPGGQDGGRACAYGVCVLRAARGGGQAGCVGRSPRLWALRCG